MAGEVETIYSARFREGLDLLSQQTDTRVSSLVMTEGGKGKKFSHDAIGSIGVSQIVSRNGDTPNNDVDHQRTWINLVGWDTAHMVDNIDVLKTLHDPKNAYTAAVGAAMKRKKDKIVLDAMFASAIRGEEGGTTTSFVSGKVVAVDSWAYGSGSGNAGLTVSKLIEAMKILKAGEVDVEAEQPYICITAADEAKLLATTELTSGDYNSQLTMVNGKIDYFMGLRFVRSEQIGVDSNSYREIPVWVPSGIMLGVGADISTRVSERDDKRYNWQIYAKMFLGAGRVDDAKVIKILAA